MRLLSAAACLLYLVAALELANAAYCSGAPEPGERTNENALNLDANLKVVKRVENGVLMYAGPDNARFPVIHLYGSPYQRGFAQGALIKEQVVAFVHKTFAYLISMAVDGMDNRFPKIVLEKIVQFGIKEALAWCAKVTAPFTPQAYFDELRGLADSSGVEYDLLLQLNLFPEITKASCSFMGSWDSASEGGKTYQLRALDYDTDGPFKDFPLVSIYHPEEDDGHGFASIGFPASIGALTGFSQAQLGMSEIGVSFPDDSFGQGTRNTPPEKVHGIPWMFLFRDVLQYSKSLPEAIDTIQAANRTCNLILGVGDGKAKAVSGIEYSGYVAVPYSSANLLPQNATWHPQVKDVVYNGMDWLCPNFDMVLGQQLQKFASSSAISPQTLAGNILPTVQTGNLHAALYDLEESVVYVSFMRTSDADESEPYYAYQRPFTALDMKVLFAVEAK